MISPDLLLKKREAKQVNYPFYRKYLRIFLENLEDKKKSNLLDIVFQKNT